MARSKKTESDTRSAETSDAAADADGLSSPDAGADDTLAAGDRHADTVAASPGMGSDDTLPPEGAPVTGAEIARAETLAASGALDARETPAGEPPEPSATGEIPSEPPYEETRAADYATLPQPHQGGSGGGFLAGLLGAALAIALGVGALWLSNPDLLRGQAPPPDFSPLESQLETQASELQAMRDQIARLTDALGGGSLGALQGEVDGRLDTLGSRLDDVSQRLAGVDDRVGAIEARPPPAAQVGAVADDAVAEMRSELDRQRTALEQLVSDARDRIAAAEAQAREVQQSAETAASTAVARAALARLQAALEAGGPFSAALGDLSQSLDAPLPPALIASADGGVATMAQLRDSFPEAARAALSASIREGVPADAGTMDRIGAFFRAQTNARSTAPRQGDDPDAILSRAEAALASGDLRVTLSELDALPPAGQTEFADWRQRAEARLDALNAADSLAQSLPSN